MPAPLNLIALQVQRQLPSPVKLPIKANRETLTTSTMATPTPTPAPAPAPAPSPPDYVFEWARSPAIAGIHRPPPSRISPNFSPPLIAMVAVLATAFLIVLYARILSRHLRRWRRRRRILRSTEPGSPPSFGEPFTYSDYFLCPYGLDDSAIRTLPLSLFSSSRSDHIKDCVVCLLEFEPGESLRTLPLCAHAFHVSCIDVWLRSHATCPLCRAVVFRLDSPFVPMRAARIRRSLDDDLLLLEAAAPPEIAPGPGPASPAPAPRRDFLKRSYSFGFERADRLVLEAATASPWRYRGRSFWSKRWPSPFAGSSSSRAARVFSFRSYRSGVSVKSPAFFRRRGVGLGFLPLSETGTRFGGGSRRSRSMASPSSIYMRGQASSSRMRCGDPEALLSPERLNRR